MNRTPAPVEYSPERITRRSFIKRTTATALAVVLALNALSTEALAADGEGSSGEWEIETTGSSFPSHKEDAGEAGDVWVFDEYTATQVLNNNNGWTLTVTLRVTPDCSIPSTEIDNENHYINSAIGFSVYAECRITKNNKELGVVAGAPSGGVLGAEFDAILGPPSPMYGVVSPAGADDSASAGPTTITETRENGVVVNWDYTLVVHVVGDTGTGPLGQGSPSPSVQIQLELIGQRGGDLTHEYLNGWTANASFAPIWVPK